MTHTTEYLVSMVAKTEEVDESGDANLVKYLQETPVEEMEGLSLNELLEHYLVWANGREWATWLPTAKVGDVPPDTY